MDKVIQQLQEIYPDIEWGMAEPSDDILKNFGNGTILFGKKDGEMKDFFILERDNKKLLWGHVIANYLNGTLEEEYDVESGATQGK